MGNGGETLDFGSDFEKFAAGGVRQIIGYAADALIRHFAWPTSPFRIVVYCAPLGFLALGKNVSEGENRYDDPKTENGCCSRTSERPRTATGQLRCGGS